jgi:hypothetical protein
MPDHHASDTAPGGPIAISRRYLADPCVVRDGDRFIAIGTSSHRPDVHGVAYLERDGAAFGVHESHDPLVGPWRYRGGLLEPLDLPQHWAPELVVDPDGHVRRDARGELWCFFSAGTDREHWIYLATSPSTDVRFRVRYRVTRGTDPHPYVDEDGTLCLLHVAPWEHPGACIVGTRLGGDGRPLAPATRLVVPTAPWMASGSYRIAEGPFVKRMGARYYLLFSGGGWRSNYGLDYAVSDRLLGEYAYDATLQRPRLLASDSARGIIDPGHCSAFDVGASTYVAHHQWTDLERTTRIAVIRPLVEEGAGALRIGA